MASNDSIISNSSYTNKDFQSIYPALLDLVKKITYRWDPSISNESDPGVILLKLNAIIADKCNYNIDKNVLECFPLSVTQERNARQLFEQLGYYMHWFIAASGDVSLRWVGEKSSITDAYTIPRFTMVTDTDSSVVYTIIEDKPLPLDGTFTTFSVLQGVPVNYAINGDELITSQSLDSDNRLYLEDYNVAENGIFIRNASALNWNDWVRKDNLEVETVSSVAKNYKFGVTLDTNVCYIEFPVNAQEIIGEGIYITYIKTDGNRGNIAPLILEKFYNDVTINVGGTDILLNSSNVQLYNSSSIANGEDTESIDAAYKGYKKVVGTFNTLVTLRDYINAIRRYENVSNGIVTDRVTDIDSQVNMVKIVNGIDQLTSVPLSVPGTLQLTGADPIEWYPFDLKFTMLYAKDHYSDILNPQQYNETFKLLEQVDLENDATYASNALAYISDTKSIQQNLNDFETKVKASTDEFINLYANSICFIKNYYPISGIIIPQYKLTQTQIEDIQNNIKLALYNNLNSREIEFGEQVDYDLVYDIILNSDERIKSIILNDITYQTYAVYFRQDVNNSNLGEFIEVRVDEVDEVETDLSNQLRAEIYTRNILAGKTPYLIVKESIPTQFFNQTNLGIKSGIHDVELMGKLTTNSVDGNTRVINVDKNTICRFYAPNLITTDEYTSYVKYEYSIGADVSPNSSYQLQSNEYIAFYWSNDDDSGYQYSVYGEGTIIKPSFAMPSGTYPVDELPGPLKTPLNAAAVPKHISGSTHELMNINYNDSSTVYDHIQSLVEEGNILSSTKTVSIQVKNEVELDSSYFCTWVLNNETDGYYVLFDTPTPDDILAGVQTKTLDSGEYFIYTNQSKSSLIILGQGTRLSRVVTGESGWNTVWECATYDYEDIVDSGLETLINKPNALVTVPANKSLTVTEMQFISISEGGLIKLVGSNNTPGTLTINSVTPLSGLSEVYYKSKNDTDFIKLPLNENQVDLNWKIHCSGVIDISPNIKFEIIPADNISNPTSGQFVRMYYENTYTDSNKRVFVSNSDVYGEGKVPVNNIVLSYYNIISDSTGVIRSPEGDNISVAFDSNVGYSHKQFDLKLYEGTYVFTADASNLEPTDNIRFRILHGSSSTIIFGGYTKSVQLQVNNTNSISLDVYVEKLEEGSWVAIDEGSYTLNLSTLKNYVVNPSIADIFGQGSSVIDDCITRLTSRAVDEDEFNFDYTYTVDDDDLIQNPLDPMSFWNYNHEYNKFTIAQLNTDSLNDIFITSKIR